MRLLKIVLLSIIALVASTTAIAQVGQAEVEDINGNIVKLNSTKDGERPTLLVLWFYCPPANRVLNIIDKNVEEWSREIKFHPVALAMGNRENGMAQEKAYVKNGRCSSFTHLFDTLSKVKEMTKIYSFPYIIIYDKEGKPAFYKKGYEDGDELKYLEVLRGLQ